VVYKNAGNEMARSFPLTPIIRTMLFTALIALSVGCQEGSQAPEADAATVSSQGQEDLDRTTGQGTSTPSTPIANTIYGPVRGIQEDGVLVFKGIRYGADTAGTRFAPPAPPEPWTEVQEAVAYGNSARQATNRGSIGLFASWISDPRPALSEDCLFLNIWTPALADQAKRPVLVWFHGGGFSSGSGSSNAYDGSRLVQRGDVVVVTVNHRLNVFGYLYLDQYGEQFRGSGNAGQLDQVASLEWVRDNIAEFGGDPDNVLIFGESGGGMKVSALMAMDAAAGLFHRAVVQSGPRLTNATAEQAAEATAALVSELGLDATTIDEIRTMAPQQIEAAALTVAQDGGPRPGSGPVLDGIYSTRHPFEPDAPPQSVEIPLLIGTTRSEMSLLAGARRPELFDLTWETLPAALTTSIPGVDSGGVIDGYRALHPDIDAPALFFEATTDNGFLRRTLTLADRKAAQGAAPVYSYLFNWNTPVDDGKWGSPHALEIGFVFDNVARSESMSGIGEEQQAIADMMSEAWIAFARTGDPNHDGLPEWSTYAADHRATMVIDSQPALIVDPRRRELDLFGDAP